MIPAHRAPTIAGAAGLAGAAICCLLAPRAPVTALAALGVIVWTCAVFTPRIGPAGDSRGMSLSMAGAALLLALLVMKDLAPLPEPSGVLERQAALATSELAWPATARNPALGAAAAQWAGLLIGGAAALALARATAGSAHRGTFVLASLAWLITGFGAVIARQAKAGLSPTEAPGWIAASKNGAGALLAMGVVLHLGLALRAWGRSRVAMAALHAAVAAALLSPLAALSSWTGLLALLAGTTALAAGWLGSTGRWKRPWLLAAATGAGIALIAAALQPALVRRMADFTGDYRLGIWRDAMALVRDSPLFGVGAGAFETVYPLFGRLGIVFDARLSHPDSSWVLLAAEWGLVPLALLAALAWRLLRPGTDATGTEAIEPGAIARAGLVAWLAAGVTDIALHRPENFAAGMILVGIAAGPRTSFVRVRGETGATAAALAAGIVLALWSAGSGARALRWSLLDPSRLWTAALADGEKTALEPANLARLRAAVKLQHRAVTYPFAAAKLVHPVSPEAAREFWRDAITRAGDLGFDYLVQAQAAFPATPWRYWLDLARETGPDHFLFIEGLPRAEAARELETWAKRPEVAKTRAAVARQFLRVARGLQRPEFIENVAARLETEDPDFWEEAARSLLEADRAKAAWRALERQLPPEEPAKPGAQRPPGNIESLLAAGRFAELRTLVLATPTEESARALAVICANEKAPAWFRLRHARALAASGDERGAVTEALRGLAGRTTR